VIDQLLAVPNGLALLYLIYRVRILENSCNAISARVNGVETGHKRDINGIKKKTRLYLK